MFGIRKLDSAIDIFQSIGSRSSQQDRFVAQPLIKGFLLAVFDGHGTAWTSDQAAARVAHYLDQEFEQDLTVPEALKGTVKQLQRDSMVDKQSGSTASIAYIQIVEEWLIVTTAQLGDSAIVIQTPGTDPILTVEHNPGTHGADRERIEKFIYKLHAEGNPPDRYRMADITDDYVWNLPSHGVDSPAGISMTRALGDWDWGELLIREPDIEIHRVPLDSVIIAVTDGVHVAETPEARFANYREFGSRILHGESARSVGQSILENPQAQDNLTIVTWRLV